MIEVYYCDITKVAVDEHRYWYLLSKLPINEQERIERFRFRIDKLLSLIGVLMVYQKAGSLEGFKRTELGKPFLANRDLYFNISHSGNYVVSAFSTVQDLGVDMEEIREIDFSDFDIVMTEREIQGLKTNEDFFTLWSQKESVIKAIGKGFTLNVKDLCIENNSCSFAARNWKLEEITIHNDYKCHLAYEKEEEIGVALFKPDTIS